jgi:hypothetical protein
MRKTVLTAVFLLFLLCDIIFSLTRNEILEQIRYYVNDTTGTINTSRWTDDFLRKRIDIVQTEIAIFTKCLRGRCLITPIADQSEYRMPNNLITIDRVSFLISGSTIGYKKLDWASMVGMDRDVPHWENLSPGLPQYYYERRNFFGLKPKPARGYCAERAIKLDYYKKPDAMVDDADEPFDNDYSLRGYHQLIILGVVVMCKKDEYKWADVQYLQQEYMMWLNLMKEYIRTKPDREAKIELKMPPK